LICHLLYPMYWSLLFLAVLHSTTPVMCWLCMKNLFLWRMHLQEKTLTHHQLTSTRHPTLRYCISLDSVPAQVSCCAAPEPIPAERTDGGAPGEPENWRVHISQEWPFLEFPCHMGSGQNYPYSPAVTTEIPSNLQPHNFRTHFNQLRHPEDGDGEFIWNVRIFNH